MMKLPLSVLAAPLLLVTATVPPLCAEEADKPPKEFDVENLKVSAEDLSEELGYKFHGATWHFTAPTYARLKVWNVVDGPDKSPKNPEKSLPPDQVMSLDGPLQTVSLRVIHGPVLTEHESSDHEQRYKSLRFKVRLSGKGAAKGGGPAGKDVWQDLLSNLMGRKLSDEAIYDRSTLVNFSTGWTDHNFDGGSTADGWLGADLGGVFSQIQQFNDVLGKPDSEVKARELMDKWRVETEEKMLKQPLEVYSYRHEQIPGGSGGPRVRVSFVLMLECSRQPFADDKSKGSDGEATAPAAAPEH